MRLFRTSLGMVVLCVSIAGYSIAVCASEIQIDGDRVIMKSDDGEVLDTDHLPSDSQVKTGNNVQVNENGVSIGSVNTKDGTQKNITRSTTVDNLTVITNGKTTIYRKEKAK